MYLRPETELLLYCLLDTTDLVRFATSHVLAAGGFVDDLYPNLGRKSAYLVRRGLLDEEITDQRKRIHRLTKNGIISALGGRDPNEGWDRPWDCIWRLVIFDIPEVDRRLRLQLRRNLLSSGFGCLQKSVWISPHPVDDLKVKLRKLKIDASMIAVFEARADDDYHPRKIVSRAWNFRRLTILHDHILDHFQRTPTASTTPTYAIQWAHDERSLWNKILDCDPFLPHELLPRRYKGKKVWKNRLDTLKKAAPLIKHAAHKTLFQLPKSKSGSSIE